MRILFLSALFLCVLGIGNILVGTYKGTQYERVMRELQDLEYSNDAFTSSPLLRLEQRRRTSDRLLKRHQKALHRRNLYGVVVVGGKALCLAGVFFLSLGVAASVIRALVGESDARGSRE